MFTVCSEGLEQDVQCYSRDTHHHPHEVHDARHLLLPPQRGDSQNDDLLWDVGVWGVSVKGVGEE